MANAEYSENPQMKYKAKGKHGIAKKAMDKPAPKAASVKMNYPHVKTKGFKFISPSPTKGK